MGTLYSTNSFDSDCGVCRHVYTVNAMCVLLACVVENAHNNYTNRLRADNHRCSQLRCTAVTQYSYM